MVFKRKFEEEDKKVQSTTVGGVEGVPMNIEVQPTRGPEKGLEVQKPEVAGERKEDQQLEYQKPQPKPQKQQTPKPKPQKKVVNVPKIYGYKIPQQMFTNMGKVRSYKDKGDPKDSLTCLSFFVDRLVKMHSA